MEDFTCTHDDATISCNFFSTLANVDRAIDTIKNFLRGRNLTINQFDLIFVLREAVNNAVIHGNNKDGGLLVGCTLRLGEDTVDITVTDQGKGFDWRRQLSKTPVSSSTTSGRGLNSMKRYGFDIRFNEAGNTLYLTKKIR